MEGGRRRLRLVSFNLAHARGLMPVQGLLPPSSIRRNLDRIAQLLRGLDPDVVALQEIDRDSIWNGRFDHLEHLRAATGLTHSAFGAINSAGMSTGLRLLYGNAVLAHHPILHAEAYRFGRKLVGEKGFVYVELDLGIGIQPVVCLHLHHRWRSARRKQAAALARFLTAKATGTPGRYPVIVLGDFNCASHVHGDAGHLLANAGIALDGYHIEPQNTRTFPSLRPLRMLDFALVPRTCRVLHSCAIRSRLSDHLPIVIDVEIGPPSSGPA